MTADLSTQREIEGVTVFRDDNDSSRYYLLPTEPSFRIDPQTKKPVFKFIKYKLPVDRPDGKKGGGFVVFDCEFVVPPGALPKIQSALNSEVAARNQSGSGPTTAVIDHIPFTAATASLTLLDTSGVLVSKIDSPSKPSLFGSMICPFTAELTPEGATVIEAAMSGSGGVAQVTYDLHFPATFPPITGTIWFNATKFYSFYQSIQKSGGSWDSSNDTENKDLQQSFINSNSGNVTFNFDALGFMDPATAKTVQDAISNWGWGQVDAATKAITLPDIAPSTDTGDDGMDHVTKTQSTFEEASFYRTINEREGISFESPQGGTLPNIVDMGFKWADYFVEVDANDPFFATISSSIYVNADFDKYKINSVSAHLEYDKITPPTVGDYVFKKPDDIGKFDSDTNNVGNKTYTYSFTVNYVDQNQSYQSQPVQTDHTAITINAGDLGILYADIAIGNVDFTKTPKVQVAITYPDTDAAGQPISQQFNFDSTKTTDTLLAVLLKPVDKSYTYVVTYIMVDGTQIVTAPVDSQASQIFVNSPLVGHTFSFLAEGDFAASIDNIFLKMKYVDSVNNVEQDGDFTFSATNRQYDWKISILANSKGQVSYSGAITYKNHTTENIPETQATSDLIEFGPPNQVIVSVAPDASLIDWTKVRLITVNLEYQDTANQIDLKQEFKLTQATATPAPWTFYARDPTKTSYTWTATFYMAGTPPTQVTTQPVTSSDTDLILLPPS